MSSDDIPYGYCQCGCGELAPLAKKNDSASGRVKGQPQRYIVGHRNFDNSPDYAVEDRGHNTPCWTWQKCKNKGGYGQATHRGKRANLAHRDYYLKLRGDIPEGMQIDHLCRNRDCVNPDHMEVVTQTENLRRGSHTKLTMDIAKYVRTLKGKIQYKDIAIALRVDPKTISNIMTNTTWKES